MEDVEVHKVVEGSTTSTTRFVEIVSIVEVVEVVDVPEIVEVAVVRFVDIDNVVRVNVDCAVFKTDVISKLDKSNKKYNILDLNSLKLEDKYSGYGTWHHYAKFEKL